MDSLTELLLRISAEVEQGNRVLRGGWVATYFLGRDIAAHNAQAAAAIRAYLAFTAASDLKWEVDEDGDWVRADRELRLSELAVRSRKGMSIGWFDDRRNASGFRMRYTGLSPADPQTMNLVSGASVLLFTYPAEFLAERGSAAVTLFHDQLAGTLPLTSGFLSPAFLPATGAGEPPAFDVIKGFSRRFPCLDIPCPIIEILELGNCVKGPYWRTYLGPEATAALNGPARIEAALAGEQIDLRTLPSGATSLNIRTPPQSGDVNRGQDLSPYRALGRLLGPVQFIPAIALPGFDLDETVAWYRRFEG